MHKVELEFKRIQTFLFASPRLRAMLGANSAIGQTLRVELTEIAHDCGAVPDSTLLKHMPASVPEDPLARALAANGNPKQAVLIDDPASIYRSHGVLVRDGGHFIATFVKPEDAERFLRQATEHITERLPGILVEARLDGDKPAQPDRGECLFQHPAFQVSHALGNTPAANRRRIAGAKEQQFMGVEEQQMEERGRRFRDHPTDLIGILEQAGDIPRSDEPPDDLNNVTSAGYLAVIHADGNGVGQRYQQWKGKRTGGSPCDLGGEAHGEHFYHSMRVAVRRALVQALDQVFKLFPKHYQLLMLGGDDLLLVCSAEHALPFVCAYAEALRAHPLCDGKPLDIGAGVAIAKAQFPFNRLHAMAEALADSAKQRSRGEPAIGSVADWHITTNAWVDDPIAERRAESLAAGAVLSGKPYPVLGTGSLQTLLEQSRDLGKRSDVARSQLRRFVEILRLGPNLAELAWCELPKGMKEAFNATGIHAPFTSTENGLRMSTLPDLVEQLEIEKLGQRKDERETAS